MPTEKKTYEDGSVEVVFRPDPPEIPLFGEWLSEQAREIVKRGGAMKQTIVCCEELAELSKVLCKVLRGKGETYNLIEELADVIICCAEILEMNHIDQDQLKVEIAYKIDRTLFRMDIGEE